MQQPKPDIAVVRELLSALFTMIDTERQKVTPQYTELLSNQSTTFRNFIAILEDNFRRPEGV